MGILTQNGLTFHIFISHLLDLDKLLFYKA